MIAPHEGVAMKCKVILLIVTAGLFPTGPLAAAQYKPEFKMSINPSEETSWGRAAVRFAAAIKYRTAEVKAFRDKTRPVYDSWAGEIGIDLVRSAESIVESAK